MYGIFKERLLVFGDGETNEEFLCYIWGNNTNIHTYELTWHYWHTGLSHFILNTLRQLKQEDKGRINHRCYLLR